MQDCVTENYLNGKLIWKEVARTNTAMLLNRSVVFGYDEVLLTYGYADQVSAAIIVPASHIANEYPITVFQPTDTSCSGQWNTDILYNNGGNENYRTTMYVR